MRKNGFQNRLCRLSKEYTRPHAQSAADCHEKGDCLRCSLLHKQSTALPVAPENYREAMSRYGGHVQIVTTDCDGVRRGITATASCSVSDDPPTVLVCVNRTNPRNAPFFESGRFALNTLSADHRTLADAFSGLSRLPEEARFATAKWDTITTGAPTLVGARAVFDCEVLELKPMSTHTVVFGQVVGLRLGDIRPALIYLDRGYHQV
jgi:cob(II)yrinic acid a,c-diamide reductase